MSGFHCVICPLVERSMEKLVALAEAYPSELELLQDLHNFGGDVYELLYQTEELHFGGGEQEP